jgi:hypothetical protein
MAEGFVVTPMKLTPKEKKIARLALDKAAQPGERQAAAAKLIESLYARGVTIEDIEKEGFRSFPNAEPSPQPTTVPRQHPYQPSEQATSPKSTSGVPGCILAFIGLIIFGFVVKYISMFAQPVIMFFGTVFSTINPPGSNAKVPIELYGNAQELQAKELKLNIGEWVEYSSQKKPWIWTQEMWRKTHNLDPLPTPTPAGTPGSTAENPIRCENLSEQRWTFPPGTWLQDQDSDVVVQSWIAIPSRSAEKYAYEVPDVVTQEDYDALQSGVFYWAKGKSYRKGHSVPPALLPAASTPINTPDLGTDYRRPLYPSSTFVLPEATRGTPLSPEDAKEASYLQNWSPNTIRNIQTPAHGFRFQQYYNVNNQLEYDEIAVGDWMKDNFGHILIKQDLRAP